MKSVQLVEVGPRDGLQSEPEILSTADKLTFIDKAVAAGVKRLEVASFVHPKRVPQMADAEDLLAALPQHDGVSYIGLVMNQRGLERALTTPVHEIGMVVVASDTYNQRNQGCTTDESIAAWRAIAAEAQAAGRRASVTIAAAFGCPFEGQVSVQRVLDIAEQLVDAEPFELGIADSIGVGVPAQVSELLGKLGDKFAGLPLRCHFHNTRNTGLANAQAAVDAGATSLDASIGGIGGCPFAPAATGNIPTDDLIYLLERSGIETGVSLHGIIETSQWLESVLQRSVPAMLPKAGGFPSGQAAG